MRPSPTFSRATVAVLFAVTACSPFGVNDAVPTGAGGGSSGLVDAGRDANAADGSAPVSVGGPYMTAVMSDGPVAYFRFDDAPGTEGVFDDVSKTKVGTIKGAAFVKPGLVDGGQGLKLEGQACIVLTDQYGFPHNAPFTIEVWARRAGASLFGHLFTKQDRRQGLKTGYALIYDGTPAGGDGYQLERFINEAGEKAPLTDAPPRGVAWHLAATYDGAMLTVFRDGTTNGSQPDPRDAHDQTAPAIIGAAAPDCAMPFEGTLDELAIFDQALSQEKILAHIKAAGL